MSSAPRLDYKITHRYVPMGDFLLLGLRLNRGHIINVPPISESQSQLMDKAGIACQLMGKRWRIHYVRMQHVTPAWTKMVTGRMLLNLMIINT